LLALALIYGAMVPGFGDRWKNPEPVQEVRNPFDPELLLPLEERLLCMPVISVGSSGA
jgi:hypothetical protein